MCGAFGDLVYDIAHSKTIEVFFLLKTWGKHM